MKRLRAYNKFYRRYEVDLWGRAGYQRTNKTVRFLQKIQREKINFFVNPGRSFIMQTNKNKIIAEEKKNIESFSKPVLPQFVYSYLVKFSKNLLNRNKLVTKKEKETEINKPLNFFKLPLSSRLNVLSKVTKARSFARYFLLQKNRIVRLCKKMSNSNLDKNNMIRFQKNLLFLILSRFLRRKNKKKARLSFKRKNTEKAKQIAELKEKNKGSKKEEHTSIDSNPVRKEKMPSGTYTSIDLPVSNKNRFLNAEHDLNYSTNSQRVTPKNLSNVSAPFSFNHKFSKYDQKIIKNIRTRNAKK